MCDCYSGKCENCGCRMEIHIADYCTPRENVHPYCQRCSRKMMLGTLPRPKKGILFLDSISGDGKYSPVEGGRKGQMVKIFCDDPDAYGIHLNQ